jgi:flagellar biosynthesis protein FlhF
MKIKEYEASSLKECLHQVREDLGPEAVILETRKARKKTLLGLRSQEVVRIVAAVGISIHEPVNRSLPNRSQANANEAERRRSEAHESVSGAGRQRNPISSQAARASAPSMMTVERENEEKLAQLERMMRELKSDFDEIRQVVKSAPEAVTAVTHSAVVKVHSQYPQLYSMLVEAEIASDLAEEMLDLLPDMSGWNLQARTHMAESALRALMTDKIVCSGPITLTPGKLKTVALIGPTGVGKTTTIAKLAAQFALVENYRVGLLTMDTYRIAAVEQLKTYGQIINIPVRVAYSPNEIMPALEEFADYDLVLIDTAGRSQKHIMQLGELKTLLEKAQCEAHLVLAASTKERDLQDQIARFRESGVDRLIFTKLDETRTYGTLFTAAIRSGLPVSYLTTGQKVPEDIEVADSNRIVSFVLNGAAK